MTRQLFIFLLMLCLPLFFVACGGQKGEEEAGGPQEPQAKEAAGEMVTEADGIAVAKEILDTFDKAVAETAELVKEKPEVADVKPQFEALIAKYKETMTELNAKYLALRDKDIAVFGSCNGYIGENRGAHVFQKDQVLDEFIVYYNLEKGEKDFSDFLSQELIDLLEIAVKH
jgi:hypothetical protein